MPPAKVTLGYYIKYLHEPSSKEDTSVGPLVVHNESPLPDESVQLGRWKNHFSALRNSDVVPNPDPGLIKAASLAPTILFGSNDEGSFSLDEINRSLKKLKNQRTPRCCVIAADLLKSRDRVLLMWLQTIFNIVWHTEIILKDCRAGIIMPLWKRTESNQ